MAKKTSKSGKFQKTQKTLFSKGKKAISKGKSAVTPVGKRGSSAIGRR